MGRAWALVVALVAAFGVSGCEPEAERATVAVCGDVRVPTDVDTVRVVLLDGELNEIRAGVRELVVCPQGQLRRLPQSFELPVDDAAEWVRVQGLRDGVEVVRFDRHGSLAGGESVQLGLTRACLGMMCPRGQTCIDGMCELAPRVTDDGVCHSGAATGDAGNENDANDLGHVQDAGDAGSMADVGSGEPLCPGADTGQPPDDDAGDDAGDVS